MQTDLIYFFKSMIELQGIQFLMVDADFSNICEMDFQFRKEWSGDQRYDDIKAHLLKILQPNTVFFIRDSLNLDYCMFPLPESIQEEYHAYMIIIGPVMFREMEPEEIRSRLADLQIPSNFYRDYLEFCNRIPKFSSFDSWISLMKSLFQELYQDSFQYRFSEYNYDMYGKFNIASDTHSLSLDALESRYEAEKKLLNAISAGNQEEALEWHRKCLQFTLESRSADPLRNQKNRMLILNTLFRKAVEARHIHPYYIDQLPSEFGRKIERCPSLKELDPLPMIMIRKYCLLVNNHASDNYSELVSRCMQYIDFHYTEPIALNTLAEQCCVTTTYLSSLFRKETGKTISEYIAETRIRNAILLLNTTKLPIQTIANQCGFSDANYFSRTFKKITGQTPLTYRKNITAV